MIKFHKVSYEQFYKDYVKINGDVTRDIMVRELYDNIELPKRATAKSAGYDFFAPYTVFLREGKSVTIPTGISGHYSCFHGAGLDSNIGFSLITLLA